MAAPAGEAVALQAQSAVALRDAAAPEEGVAGWWGLADAGPSEDRLAVGRGQAVAGLEEGGAVEKGGAGSLGAAAAVLLGNGERNLR